MINLLNQILLSINIIMNTPSIKQPNLKNNTNYYIKIKPYIPYIIGIVSLLIISIIISNTSLFFQNCIRR